MRLRKSFYLTLAALILLCPSAGLSQTMTLSRLWLPAATGSEPVTLTFRTLPSQHYELLASGGMGVRWQGQILPVTLVSVTYVGLIVAEFTVPAALRLPGFTEFVLWDRNAQQPLPYRSWISVIIPTPATVFEGNPLNGRLVAFVGADGTGTGTGGQITVYSLASGAVVQTFDVPPSQRVLAFTPDTLYAWIAQDETQGHLARMNLSTGQVDQQVQLVGTSRIAALAAQVYRPDPRILIVSGDYGYGYITTQAFADGLPLSNASPIAAPLPLPVDDRGRVLLPRSTACHLDTQAGFSNCAPVAAAILNINSLWKNKGFTGSQFIDLSTGGTLLALSTSGGIGNYLPENNRLVVSSSGGLLIMDGDSLEAYADLGRLIGGNGLVRSAVGPDWLLAPYRPNDVKGILAAHLPQLGPAPFLTSQSIVNAATFQAGPVAAGEIVSLFGKNLGPTNGSGPVLESKTELATDVEHTQVMFGGVAATILYAGPGQINVVVPEGVQAGDSIPIQVTHYGVPSSRIDTQVAQYSPGIFGYDVGGKTYAAALNPDGKVQGPGAPLRRGSQTAFYVTGIGMPAGETASAVVTRPEEILARPSVTIGGRAAQVTYAGGSPGLTAGLCQINVVIPSDTPVGNAVEMVIAQGGQTQRNIWVAIQ